MWRKKDEGSWSIAKGEYTTLEDPLEAAAREFREETGFEVPSGPLVELRPVKERSGKIAHARAAERDFDAGQAVSNRFVLEWPPKSGKKESFPEIDKAQWFNLEAAFRKSTAGQAPLLQELGELLSPAAEPE